MHELAICEAVLCQVLAIATEHGAGRVARISLEIGPLAGVEPGSLLSAFPLVAAGTLCDSAIVEIQTAAAEVECTICGAVSGVKPNRLLCGACGTWRVALISGDEMQLRSVELFDLEPKQIGRHLHV
jgi:hydrogenase nickel incorporation protein HypA/HybF